MIEKEKEVVEIHEIFEHLDNNREMQEIFCNFLKDKNEEEFYKAIEERFGINKNKINIYKGFLDKRSERKRNYIKYWEDIINMMINIKNKNYINYIFHRIK